MSSQNLEEIEELREYIATSFKVDKTLLALITGGKKEWAGPVGRQDRPLGCTCL